MIVDREQLTKQIQEWNANRLDLFALTVPDPVSLEFFGVMRFFYQDASEGAKVSTKCVRVSSTATVKAVLETLIEKFRPDMRMLSMNKYCLYEVHADGDERRMEDDDHPLEVQLSWGKDDREGRFLLKREDVKTAFMEDFHDKGVTPQPFKRKLSKREKKDQKKKNKEARAKGKENAAEQLYNELPDTSFTRTVSNPEAVMKRRRQQKLEKKMAQFKSQDGGPDSGGTLKIYGETLCPDVPYKTLLLSTSDTALMVLKETLAKYRLEKEDSNDYCLFKVNLVPSKDGSGKLEYGDEEILDDDECPLAIHIQYPPSQGSVMFQIRRRPADYEKRKRARKQQQQMRPNDMDYGQGRPPYPGMHPGNIPPEKLPFLVELHPDGREPYNANQHRLQFEMLEVGSDRNMSSSGQYLQLFGPNVHPRHCVIAHSEGIVTVTPTNKDAETYVNNQRVFETTTLQHGIVVRFGKANLFRFLDPMAEEKQNKRQPEPGMRQQGPYNGHQQPGAFETSFDVDGHVETNQGMRRPDEQQRETPPDGMRGGPVIKVEEDLLPAGLEFREDAEDQFLGSLITDSSVPTVVFKLAPTYALYMSARYRVSRHYRPDMSASERAHRLTSLVNKIAGMSQQTIQEEHDNANALAFWMANTSELLHFFKQDRNIGPYSIDAQDILAEAVQVAFRELVLCLQNDLRQTMPAFLDDGDEDADEDWMMDDQVDMHNRYQRNRPMMTDVIQTMSAAMALLRRCRVNAALTIQLFSQLFHYINMWLFNKIVMEPRLRLCTRRWGFRLKRRLARIEVWAEKQGLELAADCHLARIIQTAHLLQSQKHSAEDIANISSSCFKLNSLQLRVLLQSYIPDHEEGHVPQDLINRLVSMAENTADELIRSEGREVHLEEDPDLHLPFLLPEDGYSCDIVRGIPNGLPEFLDPLISSGICNLVIHHQAPGPWTVYMDNELPENMVRHSPGGPQSEPPVPPGMPQEPEVMLVSFGKVNGSMGLSIVAAKGEGQKERGIYIKSVVTGGAAALDGRLQAGDQLLDVDGKSLVGLTQEKAAELMTRTGAVVNLRVAKQGAIYHGLATLLSQPSPIMQRAASRQQVAPPADKHRPKSQEVSRFGPAMDDGFVPAPNRYPAYQNRSLQEQHGPQSKSTPSLPTMDLNDVQQERSWMNKHLRSLMEISVESRKKPEPTRAIRQVFRKDTNVSSLRRAESVDHVNDLELSDDFLFERGSESDHVYSGDGTFDFDGSLQDYSVSGDSCASSTAGGAIYGQICGPSDHGYELKRDYASLPRNFGRERKKYPMSSSPLPRYNFGLDLNKPFKKVGGSIDEHSASGSTYSSCDSPTVSKESSDVLLPLSIAAGTVGSQHHSRIEVMITQSQANALRDYVMKENRPKYERKMSLKSLIKEAEERTKPEYSYKSFECGDKPMKLDLIRLSNMRANKTKELVLAAEIRDIQHEFKMPLQHVKKRRGNFKEILAEFDRKEKTKSHPGELMQAEPLGTLQRQGSERRSSIRELLIEKHVQNALLEHNIRVKPIGVAYGMPRVEEKNIKNLIEELERRIYAERQSVKQPPIPKPRTIRGKGTKGFKSTRKRVILRHSPLKGMVKQAEARDRKARRDQDVVEGKGSVQIRLSRVWPRLNEVPNDQHNNTYDRRQQANAPYQQGPRDASRSKSTSNLKQEPDHEEARRRQLMSTGSFPRDVPQGRSHPNLAGPDERNAGYPADSRPNYENYGPNRGEPSVQPGRQFGSSPQLLENTVPDQFRKPEPPRMEERGPPRHHSHNDRPVSAHFPQGRPDLISSRPKSEDIDAMKMRDLRQKYDLDDPHSSFRSDHNSSYQDSPNSSFRAEPPHGTHKPEVNVRVEDPMKSQLAMQGFAVVPDSRNDRMSESSKEGSEDIPKFAKQSSQPHFFQNTRMRERDPTPPFEQLKRQEVMNRPPLAPKPKVAPKPFDGPRAPPQQEIPSMAVDHRKSQPNFFYGESEPVRQPYGGFNQPIGKSTVKVSFSGRPDSPELPPPPPPDVSGLDDPDAEDMPPPPPPPQDYNPHGQQAYGNRNRMEQPNRGLRPNEQNRTSFHQDQQPRWGPKPSPPHLSPTAAPTSQAMMQFPNQPHTDSHSQPSMRPNDHTFPRQQQQPPRQDQGPNWQPPKAKVQVQLTVPVPGGHERPESPSSSPSPWDREQREKEKKLQEEEAAYYRDREIADLEAKPYLTPDEQERLRRLKLDQEFSRRLKEVKDDDDDQDDEDDLAERTASHNRLAKKIFEDLERTQALRKQKEAIEKEEEKLKALDMKQREESMLQRFDKERDEQRQRQARKQERQDREHEVWLQKQREQREKQRQEQEEHKRMIQQEEERLKQKREDEVRRKKEQEKEQLREMQAAREAEERAIKEENARRQQEEFLRQRQQQDRGHYDDNRNERFGKPSLYGQQPPQNTRINSYGNDNRSEGPPPPQRGSSYNMVNQVRGRGSDSSQEQIPPYRVNANIRPPLDAAAQKKTVSFDAKLTTEIAPGYKDGPQTPPANDLSYRTGHQSAYNPASYQPEHNNTVQQQNQQNMVNYQVQTTPGVIGSQEVYRDPRDRRLQQQQQGNQAPGEKLSFRDKMKLFAETAGENTPKDKPRSSRSQRILEMNLATP